MATTKRTQHTYRPYQRLDDKGPVKQWRWSDSEKTPHWLKYGKGHAGLELTGHTEAGWVSVDASEYGDKSGKRTLFTLDAESVRELHAFLGEIVAKGTP